MNLEKQLMHITHGYNTTLRIGYRGKSINQGNPEVRDELLRVMSGIAAAPTLVFKSDGDWSASLLAEFKVMLSNGVEDWKPKPARWLEK